MSKIMERRITKLEQRKFGGSEPLFIIVRDFGINCANKQPRSYSREFNDPKVSQKPGETDEDFLERAIAELFGESAKEPGTHVLHEWNVGIGP